MKKYLFTFEKSATSTESRMERKAELTINDNFTFDKILNFEQEVENIFEEIGESYRRNDFINVRLFIYTYECTNKNDVSITDLDLWRCYGFAPDLVENKNGISLIHATRNNPCKNERFYIDFNENVFDILDEIEIS